MKHQRTLHEHSRFRVLLLGVTGHCNLRCQMCSMWQDSPTRLSSGHLRVVVQDSRAVRELHYLSITGGEPLLHSDLGEIVRHTVSSFVKLREFCLTTNGSLPDRFERIGQQVVLDCKARSVDCVLNLSVDGVGPVHDSQRGTTGSFERVHASLKIAKRLGALYNRCAVTLSAVITRANADGLIELLQFARNEAVRVILSLPMETDAYYRTDRATGDATLLPGQRRSLQNLLNRLLLATRSSDSGERLSRQHLEHLLAHLRGEPRQAPCVFRQREGCLVTAGGVVYLCGGGEKFRLGHLDDGAPSEFLMESAGIEVSELQEMTCNGCPSVCYLQATNGARK